MNYRWVDKIKELGPDFYDPVSPASFEYMLPRFLNEHWAQKIGFQELSTPKDWIHHFGFFVAFTDSLPCPLALRYHGHQFRHYNPDLGDGRGFLFAQFLYDHKLYDFGTKGSGQTPYSRRGDGRLTLKGAFREALATELLESYGVNTSKTFCFFETDQKLQRTDEPSPTRSAVLTRLSHGHIRIGTFQRLAYFHQTQNIKNLVQYCCENYFPEIQTSNTLEKIVLFYEAVCQANAKLAAQWMIAGFVHGVLNTDNINITGESFDYGPYRFIPEYDPNFVAAYFDHSGLYSFGRQPSTLHWNLTQLGLTLRMAAPEFDYEKSLQKFSDVFSTEIIRLFLHKLNLLSRGTEEDSKLLNLFFHFISNSSTLYEQTYFDLFSGIQPERLLRSPQHNEYSLAEFHSLKKKLETYQIADPERAKNPYFQRTQPVTLLYPEIEKLWEPIDKEDNWSPFHQKIAEIRSFRGLY